MKKFLAALMVVVLIFTFSTPKQQANADALVISQLAAAAYAIATSSGLNLSFTSGTAVGAQTYMEQRLSSWVGNQNGGISIFGSSPVKALAAKLAITQTAFNALKNFINDYISEYSISNVPKRVFEGYTSGRPVGEPIYNFGTTANGFYMNYEWENVTSTSSIDSGYKKGQVKFTFGNGNRTNYDYTTNTTEWVKPAYWVLSYEGNNFWLGTFYYYVATSENNFPGTLSHKAKGITVEGAITDSLNVSIEGSMDYPEVGLDDLQTYKKQDWAPDTNLEQMLQDIYEDVAVNDLDLTGETVEDTPVGPVPTAAPGDVIGGLDTISGQLEGIDNTLTGVQEGVGEAVGQLEGINEGVGSISEALDVPTANEATSFKFDLTTLFPFCIPFDIYRFVTMFSASPVAPHVQIPFNIPVVGLQYTFDLDFSSFDGVASVLRSVELIAFCVGLAILTSKVIRW